MSTIARSVSLNRPRLIGGTVILLACVLAFGSVGSGGAVGLIAIVVWLRWSPAAGVTAGALFGAIVANDQVALATVGWLVIGFGTVILADLGAGTAGLSRALTFAGGVVGLLVAGQIGLAVGGTVGAIVAVSVALVTAGYIMHRYEQLVLEAGEHDHGR